MNITDKLLKFTDNKNYKIIPCIILIIGIVFVMISNKSASIQKNKHNDFKVQENNTSPSSDKNDLEKNLEEILSNVEGVGETKVFISYETSDEKIALKDVDVKGGEKTVLIGDKNKSEPFIYKSNYAKIGGVIVVADRLDTQETKNMLTEVISSVLSVPVHKVKVLKSSQ